MATLIERDVHHHGEGDSSSSALIVAVLAIVVILGFALYTFQLFPFAGTPANNNGGGSINVDVDGQLPTPSNNP